MAKNKIKSKANANTKSKTQVQTKTQKNKSNTVWIVLIAVVLLGTFFYFALNTNNEEEETMKIAVLETNKGTIKIELDLENAPITTKNFIEYVESGYYDGLIFHRVMDNFMIQGGGFYPNGTQKETNAPIKLESNNGLRNNLGTIAMARTNVPDSATSQFFINVKNNNFLNYAPGNPGYAVFGKVTEGMNVVNEIKGVATTNKAGHGDWPIQDIIIIKAYME